MSKITKALNKASEERAGVISPASEHNKNFLNKMKGEKMRKTWVFWAIIACVVTVLIAFNYQGSNDAVPLSEIFPEEVEYEFIEEGEALKVASEDSSTVNEESIVVIQEEVAAVAVEEKSRDNAMTSNTISKAKDTNYTIQIASFKDERKAQAALTKIRTKVPSAYISSHDLGAKGVWYRIYAGQFEMRNEAEVSLSNIKQNYDTSFIISPKKSR